MNVELPQQTAMTPEQAFARLQLWFAAQEQLRKLKTSEHLERVALSDFYFPNPPEGTTRLPLGGGFDLKLVAALNYKVNEEELSGAKAGDIKRLKLPWDDLFVYEPKLVKSVYNGLTAEQKLYVDQFLEIKPASPQLEIVQAANKEGQAAHAAAATAATTRVLDPARVCIVEDASAAQDTDYFMGEDGGWWQLQVEANGWVAMPPDIAGELTAIRLARMSGESLPATTIDGEAPSVVLNAEDAEPGQYFSDGDNWWMLDDNSEWIEVEEGSDLIGPLNDALTIAQQAAATAKPKRTRKPRGGAK